MKIYIAGKITGEKYYKRKFRKIEKKLVKMGHSVMSPAWLGAFSDFSWEDYMKVSRSMQEVCEVTFFLPDWLDSKGAQEEFLYADKLNHKKFYNINEVPKKEDV